MAQLQEISLWFTWLQKASNNISCNQESTFLEYLDLQGESDRNEDAGGDLLGAKCFEALNSIQAFEESLDKHKKACNRSIENLCDLENQINSLRLDLIALKSN